MNFNLSVTQIIAGAFTLVGATAAASWALHLELVDQYKRDLEIYEKSDRLPAVVDKINEASERLSAKLAQESAFEELKTDNIELRRFMDKAKKDLEEASIKVTDLERLVSERDRIIEEFYATNVAFDLDEGQTKELLGSAVVVGLPEVDVLNRCEVVVNGSKQELQAGGIALIGVNNMQCKVILLSCTSVRSYESGKSNASFRFVCQ